MCVLFSIICYYKRKSNSQYLEQSSYYDYEYEGDTMEGSFTSKDLNRTIETKKGDRKVLSEGPALADRVSVN